MNNLASVGAALLAILQLVGGCSLVVDANRPQCETDRDCSALGGAFAGTVCIQSFCHASPRWQCLDSPAPAAPTGEFNVSFLVRDLASQKPKVGITVRLCRRLDVECREGESADVLTDDKGNASFKIAAGFEGYARFTGANLLPGMYFFDPPLSQDLANISVSLSDAATTAGLVGLTGTKQESDRGLVLLSVVDCMGVHAEGVKLALDGADAGSRPFYSANGLPSAQATETDDAGYGGVVNVSPGTVTIKGALASTGREIASVTVQVQPGTMTIASLVAHGK